MPLPTRGCKLMVEARETRGGTQSRPKITKIAVLVNGLNIKNTLTGRSVNVARSDESRCRRELMSSTEMPVECSCWCRSLHATSGLDCSIEQKRAPGPSLHALSQ